MSSTVHDATNNVSKSLSLSLLQLSLSVPMPCVPSVFGTESLHLPKNYADHEAIAS